MLRKIEKINLLSRIFLYVLLLFGCTDVWKLKIISIGSHGPIFCFYKKEISNEDNHCDGNGQFFALIYVQDVSINGQPNLVWSISNKSNADKNIKTLEYGVLPSGWVEDIPPQKIKIGNRYRINDAYDFICDKNGACSSWMRSNN